VADLAGVSIKTASRVFNGHASVSPQTAARVRDAARELRFRPNGAARELRRGGSSAAFALVVGDLANPFYSQIAAAAERLLREHGIDLFLASSDDDPAREAGLVRSLLERRVRAVLLVPASTDQSYLLAEQELGTPLVFLDRPPSGLQADTVVIDNREGARLATQQLIDLGHRRIAVLGNNQGLWTSQERMAGARAALDGAGVDHPDLLLSGIDEPEQAQLQTRRLLGWDTSPTAFLCLNNRVTLGVLAGLREQAGPGRRIDALGRAVIGFDDFDAARLLDVTVLRQDPAALGRTAVELALSRMSAAGALPARQIVLPVHLVCRGSGERPPPAERSVPAHVRSTWS
jgi:LacI family transcriptional regulator